MCSVPPDDVRRFSPKAKFNHESKNTLYYLSSSKTLCNYILIEVALLRRLQVADHGNWAANNSGKNSRVSLSSAALRGQPTVVNGNKQLLSLWIFLFCDETCWFNFQRIILCWVLVLIQLFAVIASRSDLIGTRLIWPRHVIVYYYYYCYFFTSLSLLLSFFTFLNPSFTRESSISLPSTKLLRVIERRSALGLILSEARASSEWQAADLQCVAARQFGLDRDL